MIRFLNSFGCAFRGLYDSVRSERNLRIQLSAAVMVVLLCPVMLKSAVQLTVILLLLAAVIAAELFNTAIENLADRVTKETSEEIRRAKDSAAGGVLILALCAVATGCIILFADGGFMRLWDFSEEHIWYPILLIILATSLLFFIRWKRK